MEGSLPSFAPVSGERGRIESSATPRRRQAKTLKKQAIRIVKPMPCSPFHPHPSLSLLEGEGRRGIAETPMTVCESDQ